MVNTAATKRPRTNDNAQCAKRCRLSLRKVVRFQPTAQRMGRSNLEDLIVQAADQQLLWYSAEEEARFEEDQMKTIQLSKTMADPSRDSAGYCYRGTETFAATMHDKAFQCELQKHIQDIVTASRGGKPAQEIARLSRTSSSKSVCRARRYGLQDAIDAQNHLYTQPKPITTPSVWATSPSQPLCLPPFRCQGPSMALESMLMDAVYLQRELYNPFATYSVPAISCVQWRR